MERLHTGSDCTLATHSLRLHTGYTLALAAHWFSLHTGSVYWFKRFKRHTQAGPPSSSLRSSAHTALAVSSRWSFRAASFREATTFDSSASNRRLSSEPARPTGKYGSHAASKPTVYLELFATFCFLEQFGASPNSVVCDQVELLEFEKKSKNSTNFYWFPPNSPKFHQVPPNSNSTPNSVKLHETGKQLITFIGRDRPVCLSTFNYLVHCLVHCLVHGLVHCLVQFFQFSSSTAQVHGRQLSALSCLLNGEVRKITRQSSIKLKKSSESTSAQHLNFQNFLFSRPACLENELVNAVYSP